MPFFDNIQQDWKANKGNTKGKLIILLFRICAAVSSNKFTRIIFIPYIVFYKLFVEWVLGLEIPGTTKIGKGFQIYHGQATIIHKNAVIGEFCVLRQCTTIGTSSVNGECPVIGSKVDIGCNVCIIGPVIVGDNVTIGAGTVITKDVPCNCIVVGNPARVIKKPELEISLNYTP